MHAQTDCRLDLLHAPWHAPSGRVEDGEDNVMNEIYLFVSTYVLVFALGVQSLNVNNGHVIAAFFTSFVIGAANLVLYKLAPNASPTEIMAFLIGGPFGIVSAMRSHGWIHERFRREASAAQLERIRALD
jgi:hypothetical protein